MHYNDLREKVLSQPIFTFEDIFKYFPQENQLTLKAQLSRWVKKSYLKKIKRGVFILAEAKIDDEFALAPIIYSPSYISLESALNSYGLIPDIPFIVTSVTFKKTKIFKTPFGSFSYRHLKPSLFFGYQMVGEKPYIYKIAHPEKALLDYFYFNPHFIANSSFVEDYRLDLKGINWSRLKIYARVFANKKINKALKILIKYHAQ